MTEEEFLTTCHEYGFETRMNGKYRQAWFFDVEDRMVLLAEWNPDKERDVSLRDLFSRDSKDGSPIYWPAGMVCGWCIKPLTDVFGEVFDVGTSSEVIRFSQIRKFKLWVEIQARVLKEIKKDIKKAEIKYTEFTL